MSELRRALALVRDASTAMTPAAVTALAAFAPGVLVDLATSREPWWARRAAMRALARRLDDVTAPRVVERALDDDEVEEVRVDALSALASSRRAEVLPALRALRARIASGAARSHSLGDAAVAASASLGDASVALDAVRLRCDPWSHRQRAGAEAVDALAAALTRAGLARALGGSDDSVEGLGALALGHPEPAVRRWAVDVAPPDAPWVLDALRDDAWIVAEGAHDALQRATNAVVAPLIARAKSDGLSAVARARAIYALLRRGRRRTARRLWETLPDGRITLPGVPASVRRVVLHQYLPGRPGTDPRWRLEGVFDHGHDLDLDDARESGPDGPPETILEAAASALRDAGFAPRAPVPIGRVRQQGGGTYSHLGFGDSVVSVCELGRFVTFDDVPPPPARAALERAGFLVVDEDLGARRFEGLHVYFFGRREPLPVADLLFYWQD